MFIYLLDYMFIEGRHSTGDGNPSQNDAGSGGAKQIEDLEHLRSRRIYRQRIGSSSRAMPDCCKGCAKAVGFFTVLHRSTIKNTRPNSWSA